MTYDIELKSHGDYSDFYDSCEAKNIDEATDNFMKRLPGWNRKLIKKQVRRIK